MFSDLMSGAQRPHPKGVQVSAVARSHTPDPGPSRHSRLYELGKWFGLGAVALGSYFGMYGSAKAEDARPKPAPTAPSGKRVAKAGDVAQGPNEKKCEVTTTDLERYAKETTKYRLGDDQLMVHLPDGRTYVASASLHTDGQGYFSLQIAGNGAVLPLALLGVNDPSKITLLVEVGEDAKGKYYQFYAVPSDIPFAQKALVLYEAKGKGEFKGGPIDVCKPPTVASR